MKQLRDDKGFTLPEILVSMTIFMIIVMVTAASFNTIATHVSQQSKSAETLVEEVVGLEMLRSDLKQAGFGLPWSFQAAPAASAYKEAQIAPDKPAANFWPTSGPPAPATSWVNSFNDAPGNPPRAIQSAETLFNQGSDGHGSKYVVIKSMLAGSTPLATGATPPSKKWTNVAFAGGLHTLRLWGDTSPDPNRDLAASDRVIVVKNSLNTTPPTQQLMVSGTGAFSTRFDNYSTLTQPHQDGDTFEVYGVDSGDLIMPFNRADYYVRTPATGMPADCAPHTGVLYKATLRHSDGSFVEMPLLDCVADLQVVYGRDSSGAGTINIHSSDSFASAQEARDQLREIRVYLLSHDGKKDRGYKSPLQLVPVGESFGGTLQGRVFDLQALIGPDWQNYRWKVHTIVVRPKNLF